MESTTLASGEDAGLILKLYELRREPTMRAARHWLSAQFWPQTAEEVFLVQNEFGSQHNQYLRQVLTYWEMAASFVLRGALDADLFLECNSENIFLLAKFRPLLNEIRVKMPDFLLRTEQVISKHGSAAARLERYAAGLEERRLRAQGSIAPTVPASI